MAVREYYYGVRRVATTHRYLKTKLEPFVLRKDDRAVPSDAVIVKESIHPPEELRELAKQLCDDCNDCDYEDGHSLQLIAEPPQVGDISIGNVVMHSDDEGSHLAIILDFPGNDLVWALFFSSKPWGDRFRLATDEEIALAGFVSKNETYKMRQLIPRYQSSRMIKTYLNLALRQRIDFCSRGISFPEHRIKDLRREYLGK